MQSLCIVTTRTYRITPFIIRPIHRHIVHSFYNKSNYIKLLSLNSRYFSSKDDNNGNNNNNNKADNNNNSNTIKQEATPESTEATLTNISTEETSTDGTDTIDSTETAEETVEETTEEEQVAPPKVSVVPGVGMITNPNPPEPEPEPEETVESTENIDDIDTIPTEEELAAKEELEFITAKPSETIQDIKDTLQQEIEEKEEEVIETTQHRIEESAMEIQSTYEEPIEVDEDTAKTMVSDEKKLESKEEEKMEDEDGEHTTKEERFWSKWFAYFKDKFSPTTDWWLHFGNGLAICSMAMQEMVPLRCFAVIANICALVFYQSQTPPLKIPSYWSIVFATGHSIMITRLLLENRKVNMSEVEHVVYCNAFREYGFTPFQFKKIMQTAKYMRVEKGDIICNEGTPKKKTMYVLGAMQLQQNGCYVGGLINGFVGDIIPMETTIKKEEEAKVKVIESVPTMVHDIEDIEEKEEEKTVSTEEDVLIFKDSDNEDKKESKIDEEEKEEIIGREIKPDPVLELVSDVVDLLDVADQEKIVEDVKKTVDAKKEEDAIDQKAIDRVKENVLEERKKEDPNVWQHTVVALETSTIFVWDTKELHKLLTSDPRLKQAAIQAVGGDLRRKLKTDKKFNRMITYRTMLEVVMYNNSVVAEEKAQLKKFREENDISLSEHEGMIKTLGWTMEEFDRGLKHSESTVEKMRNWYLLNLTTRYTTD